MKARFESTAGGIGLSTLCLLALPLLLGQESCEPSDADLDGFSLEEGDCNDGNPNIYPGAPELCNQLDDDCDQQVDELENGCAPGDRPDLNLDGWPDALVVNATDYAAIYWGSSQGPSAANHTALPLVDGWGACVEDLNRDGYLDVVLPNYSTDSYIYWGGPGGPRADFRTTLPSTASSQCAVGDFNADQWPDLALSSYGIGETRVYYGSPTGYDPKRFAGFASFNNGSLLAQDINGDGIDDLLQNNTGEYNDVTSVPPTFINLFWGSVTGLSATSRASFPSYHVLARPVAVDLNLDGYQDVVIPNSFGSYAMIQPTDIYYGTAQGFGKKVSLPTAGPSSVVAADLNEDGWPDLAFGTQLYNVIDGAVGIYWGSPAGFSETHTTALTASHVTVDGMIAEDLDQDGHLELVVPASTGGYYFECGPEGCANPASLIFPGHEISSASAGDVNLDGELDLLLGAAYYRDPLDPTYLYWGGSQGFSTDQRVELSATVAETVLIVGGSN